MECTGTILLVENNADDILLIGIACRKAGLTNPMAFVCDGKEAVDYLKGEGRFAARQRYPMPCLILLDLEMPRMNGFEVLTWLRAQNELRHLPVIVLATSAFSPDITRAYQLGANSFLTKPADLADLTTAIKQMAEFWLGPCRLPSPGTPAESRSSGQEAA